MNEKIPLRTLADRVAETTGRSSSDMETLIKRLFELIAEGLHEGRKVEVKGLGTFSLSDNPADPVEFCPAAAWAERVNAPFAMFEPEELAEEATESDFDDIRPETPAAVQAREEDTLLHADAMTDAPEEEPQPQAAAETDIVAEEVVAACDLTPVMHEAAPAADAVNEEKEQITAEPDIIAETEAESTPISVEATETAEPAEIEDDHIEDNHEEPIMSASDDAPAADNGFGKGFIVGLIVGLAIGALALCCYVMYFVHSSGSAQPIETELVEDSPAIAE